MKLQYDFPLDETTHHSKRIGITTIIATYGRAPFSDIHKNPLYWTLCALIECNNPPQEIIVVDNTPTSSSNYTASVINEIKEHIAKRNIHMKILLETSSSSDAANARNIAIHKATYPYVHALDDDCIIHKDAFTVLRECIYYLENSKRIERCALICLPQNKRATFPVKVVPQKKITTLDKDTLQFTGTISSTFPEEYLSIPPMKAMLNPLSLQNFQGGNVLIVKKPFLALGGYPSYKLPMTYGEETGIALAIQKNNKEILYFPFTNMQAVHLSYGNENPPLQLMGENWTYQSCRFDLDSMVLQSTQARVDTGARVENYIYFYTKILGFAIILDIFDKQNVNKWFKICEKAFVTKNEPLFMDGKKIIENKSMRAQILDVATDDFFNGRYKTKEELRSIFSTTTP